MDHVVVKSPFRGTEEMAQQLGDLSSVPRTGIKKPDMVVYAGNLSAGSRDRGLLARQSSLIIELLSNEIPCLKGQLLRMIAEVVL